MEWEGGNGVKDSTWVPGLCKDLGEDSRIQVKERSGEG